MQPLIAVCLTGFQLVSALVASGSHTDRTVAQMGDAKIRFQHRVALGLRGEHSQQHRTVDTVAREGFPILQPHQTAGPL